MSINPLDSDIKLITEVYEEYKFTKMKSHYYQLLKFLTAIFLITNTSSCKKSYVSETVKYNNAANFIQQMKTASTNLQKITTLSSEITASEGFKKIQTEEDLNKLKNTILNPETMLPCNLFNNKLQLLSIGEFLEKQNKELSKGVGSNIDPFSKVKSDFEASVHIGDFYTEMYIKMGEKSYKTLCFLNKDGIVYNNILSYFIVIRSKEKNKNEITFNNKSAMPSTSFFFNRCVAYISSYFCNYSIYLFVQYRSWMALAK